MIGTGGLYRCGGQNAVSDTDAQIWAEQTLASLSLEEKIGQLICVDITADYITEDDPKFQNWVRLAREADLVVLSLFVQRTRQVDTAPFRENDLRFLKELFKTGPKPFVAMSYGNPFLIRKIAEVPSFLVGFAERGWYGKQAVYFDSFIKLLKGDLFVTLAEPGRAAHPNTQNRMKK